MEFLMHRFSRHARIAKANVKEVVMLEHAEAMTAYDLEDMVRECMGLFAFVQRSWKSSIEFLYGNEVGNFDEVLPIMRRAMWRSLYAIRLMNKLARRYVAKGYVIQDADKLSEAVPVLEQMCSDLLTKWPRPHNPRHAAKAVAEYNRGEYQKIEDMLRETTGDSLVD